MLKELKESNKSNTLNITDESSASGGNKRFFILNSLSSVGEPNSGSKTKGILRPIKQLH